MMSRFGLGILCLVGMSCVTEGLVSAGDSGGVSSVTPSLDAGVGSDGGTAFDGGVAVCGDGRLDPREYCDDGNALETDDCANDCTPTAPFLIYDEEISSLLARHDVPGATLAVTKDERLVLLRAYGEAHRDEARVMARHDRMRIASLSKPITAVAVLLLVERGLLSLADSAFDYFEEVSPPAGRDRDPRLADITIEQLLVHSGGWNRSTSGDPMFKSRLICQALNISGPATAEDTIRYMLGQPLDFDPGSDYHYSNFGYSVLGRIIERVTGRSYEAFVQDEVLAPMGIRDMEIGRTFPADQPEDEVHYHLYEGAIDVVSVFPEIEGRIPRTEGGWHQEALDSHGGWIAHAEDLARFLTGVDGRLGRGDILSAETVGRMTARPNVPHWQNRNVFYAMGWMIRPTRGDANWWHNGALPGTSTLFVRTYDGLSWVILTNGRPQASDVFLRELDEAMGRAARGVTDWPDYDLFERSR